MQVYIDFDYTLFDTNAMREGFIYALDFAVTREQFVEAEQALWDKKGVLYTLEKHAEELAKKTDKATIGQIEEIMSSKLLDHGFESLYPDAISFLENNKEHDLHIITFGDPEWQREKIKCVGITDLVLDVITTDQPKEQLLSKLSIDGGAVFLSDRGSEIDAMKQELPNERYIWVHRLDAPYYNESCEYADYEVADLNFIVSDLIR